MSPFENDKRGGNERRADIDRRKFDDPQYNGPERRTGKDRRITYEWRTS